MTFEERNENSTAALREELEGIRQKLDSLS
jgi:hypothetical protein